MPALGQFIREAREAKGLSLQSVASATKIRENVLAALEREAYDALPAPVYVRGLLRTLARHLNMDAEQLLAMYKEAVPQADISDPSVAALATAPKPEAPPSPFGPHRPAWLTPSGVLMALVVVLLMAGVTWGGAQVLSGLAQARPTHIALVDPNPTPTLAFALDPTRVAPTPTVPPTVPAVVYTPTALPHPASFEVKLDISSRAWVRVEVDGAEAYQGILEAGTSKAFTARNRVTLRTGNGGGVAASLNGQPQGVLGEAGAVVDRQWVMGDNGAISNTPPTWTNPPTAPTSQR